MTSAVALLNWRILHPMTTLQGGSPVLLLSDHKRQHLTQGQIVTVKGTLRNTYRPSHVPDLLHGRQNR
jgi:hypothetical protein